MASTWRTKPRPGAARRPRTGAVGQHRIDRFPVQAEAGVGRQALGQVVGRRAFPQGEGDGDRVLLDGLVGLLAADTAAHRRDQHLGGGQERQVAVELALDHRGVGTEAFEHRQEGLEQAVGGEERPGATRRTTEHDTSPSFHWSPTSSDVIDR